MFNERPAAPLNDEHLFHTASERLGLPYDLTHYYLPLVQPGNARSLGDTPFVSPGRLISVPVVEDFAAQIAAEFRANLPGHEDAKALGLGLGYGYPETHIYQQVVASYKPDLIVEIGAGVSTFFARQGSKDCRIICIEPYPAPRFERWCAANRVELWQEPLQAACPKLRFEGRCILFVDSTHVAKITSELHLVFLELLPKLPPGALIHFHDIFVPYPCLHGHHNSFAQTANWYESMLLGIFLSASKDYETVFPQYYLGRNLELQPILERAVPSYANGHPEGSAYWLRKSGKANAPAGE